MTRKGAPPASNLRVVVRVRPFNSRERDRNAQCIVKMEDKVTTLQLPKDADGKRITKGSASGPRAFTFDHSYWSFSTADPTYATQEAVFKDLGKPLLDNAFEGFNNCIFAYGQTGAGKSYSMMGTSSEPGVVPRICKGLFERTAAHAIPCTVEVSYLEIYNERVRDLLNPTNSGTLKVREHKTTGPYVEDLTKLNVVQESEINDLMERGNRARKVAATQMNETSSRSHAVFTLTLTQLDSSMGEKVAKISLVDLAGSERATSTGATGERLKEGAEINRSLSALGRVIAALADNSSGKKSVLVPYRDSVLTWLLKDSLGGNSLTAMIAAISPADINYDETLSTLRYADSAKRIKTTPTVNEDPNARIIRELQEELQKLRGQLGDGPAPGPSEESVSVDKQTISIEQEDGTFKEVSRVEIIEQLAQSQKLYEELKESWEGKVQQARDAWERKEKKLAILGMSILDDFRGVSAPEKMPHLINLDQNTTGAWLLFNLTSKVTLMGSDVQAAEAQKQATSEAAKTGGEAAESRQAQHQYMLVTGLGIQKEHCEINKTDEGVTLTPREGASVMINGVEIQEETRLRSGSRIILGGTMSMLFQDPTEKEAVDELPPPVMPATPSMTPRTGHNSLSQSATPNLRHRPTKSLASPVRTSPIRSRRLTADLPDLLRESEYQESSGSRTSSRASGSGALSADSRLSIPTAELEQIQQERAALEAERAAIAAQKAQLEERERELAKSATKEREQSRARGWDQCRDQVSVLRKLAARWRSARTIALAEQILRLEALVKEAQVLATVFNTNVAFQLCIVETGIAVSKYDLALGGSAPGKEADWEAISKSEKSTHSVAGGERPRPRVAIRVSDFDPAHTGIRIWSIPKLRKRVGLMRSVQRAGKTEGKVRAPVNDMFMPKYSNVCEAEIPLTAVFFRRVQDYQVELLSPYTGCPVGNLHLSVEPAELEDEAAHAKSELLFKIILHKLTGFPEYEGTEVHAQLVMVTESDSLTPLSTHPVSGFGDGPIHFDTVHHLSVQPNETSARLKFVVFAQVSRIHLEKLLSWDDIRDSSDLRLRTSRLAESEYAPEERHDLLVRTHILEIGEDGLYAPAPVYDNRFHLRQGLERRIAVGITWAGGPNILGDIQIEGLRAGRIRKVETLSSIAAVLDKVPAENDSDDDHDYASASDSDVPVDDSITLQTIAPVAINDNNDGTFSATIVAQWDSSAHHSILLDRTTPGTAFVRLRLLWNILSSRLSRPVTMSTHVNVRIRPRVPRTGLIASVVAGLAPAAAPLRSATTSTELSLRPLAPGSAIDLWRLSSRDRYVRGEEMLTGWTPRGPSLVSDYLRFRRRRELSVARNVVKVLYWRALLRRQKRPTPVPQPDDVEIKYTPEQRALLERVISIWRFQPPSPMDVPGAPARGAAFAPRPALSTSLYRIVGTAAPAAVPAKMSHSGPILLLLPGGATWSRRWGELRYPFLHVLGQFEPTSGAGAVIKRSNPRETIPAASARASTSGRELLFVINLAYARVIHSPDVARLIEPPSGTVTYMDVPLSILGMFGAVENSGAKQGPAPAFAVAAANATWIFCCPSPRDKAEWILKIDQAAGEAEDRL